MEDIVTVLLATGDNLLQPVVSEMADAKVVGIAVKSERIIEQVEDLLPNVTVIADFMDPGMEVVKRLSHHYSKTRVIYIITSDNEKETKEVLITLEVYDFLPHTFRKSELHQMIQEPRGLHHLVGEGLRLEQLIGRPPKFPRNKPATYVGLQHKEASPPIVNPLEMNNGKRDKAPLNLFDKLMKGIRLQNIQPKSDLTKDVESNHQATSTHHQVTSNYRPVTSTYQPVKDANQPVVSTYQPVTNTYQPVVSTYQPVTNTLQPLPNTTKPATNTTKPATNTTKPATNTTKPVPNVEQPGQALPIKVVKQQIVTFWSAKPGTGKTFLAVNTAVSLARSGVRVVLVDGDILNLSVGVYLNLQDEKKTLEKALKCDHNNEVDKCFIFHPRFPSLAILSGSDHCRPESYCSVSKENVEKLLEYLKTKFDVIIFDTASDIQTVTTFVALHQATRVVLLTNQDYAQVFATKRMFTLLKRLNFPPDRYYLVLNGELENCKLTRSMVGNMLGRPVNQVIPFLPIQVLDSIFDSNPLVLQNSNETLPLRKQIQCLADELFPVSSCEKVSLLNNLTKLLGKRGSMSYG